MSELELSPYEKLVLGYILYEFDGEMPIPPGGHPIDYTSDMIARELDRLDLADELAKAVENLIERGLLEVNTREGKISLTDEGNEAAAMITEDMYEDLRSFEEESEEPEEEL